jgi:hypothetical protein
MSFFDSDIVRAELTEISILQEDIYKDILRFPFLSLEEKTYHIQLLEKLIEKQKVIYTRVSLSDDPEALELKERIIEAAFMMGFKQGRDMNAVFSHMQQVVEEMKEFLEDGLDNGNQT